MGYGVQPLKVSSGTCDGLQKTVKTDYVLQVLESVPCARYLVVDISILTWNSHFDCVTANANRTLGFI